MPGARNGAGGLLVARAGCMHGVSRLHPAAPTGSPSRYLSFFFSNSTTTFVAPWVCMHVLNSLCVCVCVYVCCAPAPKTLAFFPDPVVAASATRATRAATPYLSTCHHDLSACASHARPARILQQQEFHAAASYTCTCVIRMYIYMHAYMRSYCSSVEKEARRFSMHAVAGAGHVTVHADATREQGALLHAALVALAQPCEHLAPCVRWLPKVSPHPPPPNPPPLYCHFPLLLCRAN